MDTIVHEGDHSVYLALSKDALQKTDKAASDEAKNTYEKKDKEFDDTLMHGDATLKVDEMYFEGKEEAIEISGDLYSYGTKIAYTSMTIKLPREILTDIIDHAIKKLNKFKTVMEAIN